MFVWFGFGLCFGLCFVFLFCFFGHCFCFVLCFAFNLESQEEKNRKRATKKKDWNEKAKDVKLNTVNPFFPL